METNSPIFAPPAPDPADASRALRRLRDGRVLAGVATGLARYLDIDVSLVRLGFGALVVIGGIGVPVYLACWLLVPKEGDDASLADDLLDHAGGWRGGDEGDRVRALADRAEDAMHRAAGGQS